MSISVFSADYLESLVSEAASSSRLRQHRTIHADHADPVQRMFNAIEPDSYIRPHRHSLVPRTETMIAVRGLMALLIFDDSGQVVQSIKFGAGRYAEAQAVAVGAEIPPGKWHMVVALEPGSVMLEVKAGPFDPSTPKELAPWAPAEGSEVAQEYLQNLKAEVLG